MPWLTVTFLRERLRSKYFGIFERMSEGPTLIHANAEVDLVRNFVDGSSTLNVDIVSTDRYCKLLIIN